MLVNKIFCCIKLKNYELKIGNSKKKKKTINCLVTKTKI